MPPPKEKGGTAGEVVCQGHSGSVRCGLQMEAPAVCAAGVTPV